MVEVKKVRRTVRGTVVGASSDKTVKVLVTRKYQHALYRKMVTEKKNYLAHDEKNLCAIGDVVTLQECAPVSKKKKWFVKERVESNRR